MTTTGTQRYIGHFDHPYLFGSPYRLRALLAYERDDQANYFGVGDDGNEHLRFPGSPDSFTEFSDYENAIQQEVGGTTYAKYNQWKSQQTSWGVIGERDFLGGILRPLLGLQFRYAHVGDYTGSRVDAKSASGDEVRADQLPTKLFEDTQAGLIDGFDGGWMNFVKVGVSLDTRDFEPDPSTGILAQVMSEIATRYLGSDYEYQRVTTSIAGYQDVLPGDHRLVIASRALYSMQFGEVPFYSLSTLAAADKDRDGLGAFESMRGFKRKRFIGESAVLLSAELRWSITEWNFWSQNLRPILTPFVDAGRAFDGTALKFDDWHVGYGIGLKLAWNLATVVSFDYGVSEEDSIFYMELGHQF
jgi:outer membrane protein assembly factor BamA